MKSKEYWAQRFALLEEQLSQQGIEYYRSLEKQYRRAAASLEADISYWYSKFAKNNEISYADAKKLLNFGELEEFKWTVEDYIRYGEENGINGEWVQELTNASSRVHVTRLTALQTSLRQRAELLAASLDAGLTALGQAVYKEAYLKTAYEIQKGLNLGWQIGIDENRAKKLLSKPWTTDNKIFSDRIWTNKQSLIGTIETQLTHSIIRGDPPDKVISTVTDRFEVNKNQAARLIMTESAFFSAAALQDCFNDLGVEKYRVVATLDLKTSPICQEMDGKVFEVKDFKPGVTAHPFHPWCRTIEAPHIEGIESVRAARDPETGKTEYVPSDITYPEWYQKYVVDKYGADRAAVLQKMADNETADRDQYQDLKFAYGKDLPETFEEFQEMRYNDTEWASFKSYSESIKRGDLSTLADFKLYKQVSAEIDSKLVGLTTQNGIEISCKANHFVDRAIGSIEQRRSGVAVDDIATALQKPDKIWPIKELKSGKSQKFTLNDICEVTVNPETGKLIQVNPSRMVKKG